MTKELAEVLIVNSATWLPAKSGSYPILALHCGSKQIVHVRRDDGRFNVQYPDGSISIMTRDEILEGLADIPEGEGGDGPRLVRDWLALQ